MPVGLPYSEICPIVHLIAADASSKKSGYCYAINFDISENVVFEPFVFKPKNPHAFIKGFERTTELFQKKYEDINNIINSTPKSGYGQIQSYPIVQVKGYCLICISIW